MTYNGIVERLLREAPKKPKVFVSYHHKNDQEYYNLFSSLFGNVYELFTDNSVDRIIGSDNSQYQRDRIRDEYITGTSITIVLCGAESWKRKFIDWEICSTLNKRHALLGIILPTNPASWDNKYNVPSRLQDNIGTGFAHCIHWTKYPAVLEAAIYGAQCRARSGHKIDNSRNTMKRNLP
jgi:hypothetical protein